MLIDSVKIKLERIANNKFPNYSLTIFGTGKVAYEGFKNVDVKGRVEEDISKDKIIDLLSELKESNFFGINDNFKDQNSPSDYIVRLSVSFKDNEGRIVSKAINHNSRDDSIPNSIKNFEDKVDLVVNSKKWVKKNSLNKKTYDEHESVEEKIDATIGSSKPVVKNNKDEKRLSQSRVNSKRPAILKNKKLLIGILSVLIVVFIVLAVFMSGLLSSNEENNDTADFSDIYDPPKVSYIATISQQDYTNVDNIIFSGSNPSEKQNFSLGDTVYLFFRFSNITHNGNYSIIEDIEIFDQDDDLVDEYTEEFSGLSSGREMYDTYHFSTDLSMQTGPYKIEFSLTDEISSKTISFEKTFNLIESKPEVLVLTTASDVRAYQDYDENTSFEQGSSLYVYTEYSDIETINNNESCNISLSMNVTLDGVVYYNNSVEKDTVKNNTQAWWFTTNDSWPTNKQYTVNLYLYDNIDDSFVADSVSFILTDKTPSVVVLTTASNVRAYQDYDEEDSFDVGDTIFVYTEYNDIKTYDSEDKCNITLSLNVTSDDVLYYSNIVNKTSVGNMSHAWWFTADSSWQQNTVYTVSLYLFDNRSSKSKVKESYFAIS